MTMSRLSPAIAVLVAAGFASRPVVAETPQCAAPNVLILLDVSGSMKSASNPDGKYAKAVPAITGVADQFTADLRLGLMVFPDPAQGVCGVSTDLAVAPALDSSGAIRNYLELGTPEIFSGPQATFDTPMKQALEAAGTLPVLQDAERRSYVLLIADGMQDCCRGGDYDTDPDCILGPPAELIPGEVLQNRKDLVDVVQALVESHIPVFVVGFGSAVDALTLNAMAVAAGTAVDGCDPAEGDPTKGKTCYYPVDSTTELANALASVVQIVGEEVCDGLDNDCNGEIDEGFDVDEPCDGEDPDSCKDGLIACDLYGRAVCTGESLGGVAESCNGADDDCDGETDEGFVLGQACDGDDADQCVDGVLVCDGTGQGVTCREDGTGHPESCNGADDDCDGETDEGFVLGQACDGDDADLCVDGVVVCDGTGLGVTCREDGTGHMETCNGQDDDCDGETDEGFSVGPACDGDDGDRCKNGTLACSPSGTDVVCKENGPGHVEECNAVDDDCDGETDEDADVVCESACGVSVRKCGGGVLSECQAAVPLGEDLCGNGRDDDCDGQTDEDWEEACETACGTGVESCAGGVLATCTAPRPADEACNLKDDDCDGETDDGELCLDGGQCFCGGCQAPCGLDGSCPGELACVDGMCVVDQCPTGLHCEGRTCTDRLPAPPVSKAGGGCGCRADAGAASSDGTPVALGFLALAWAFVRRRRVA